MLTITFVVLLSLHLLLVPTQLLSVAAWLAAAFVRVLLFFFVLAVTIKFLYLLSVL